VALFQLEVRVKIPLFSLARVECLALGYAKENETLGDKLEVRKFGEVMGEKRKINNLDSVSQV
jgi:hypothetical protein